MFAVSGKARKTIRAVALVERRVVFRNQGVGRKEEHGRDFFVKTELLFLFRFERGLSG